MAEVLGVVISAISTLDRRQTEGLRAQATQETREPDSNWTRASRTTADTCGFGSFATFRFVVSLMMSSYSSGGSVTVTFT